MDRHLFFNSADQFNDPFDFLPTFTMSAPRHDVLRYLAGTQNHPSRRARRIASAQIYSGKDFPVHEKEAIGVAEESLAEVRQSTGVLCVAAHADHMLLWSHYANSHRGIALRFSPRKGDEYFEQALQVTYQSHRPKCNFVLHDTGEMFKNALLTKADFWAYENEWRIVKGVNSKGSYKFPDTSLDGIILGAMISPEHERDVRDWVAVAGLNIQWLRATVHKQEFRLEIAPC